MNRSDVRATDARVLSDNRYRSGAEKVDAIGLRSDEAYIAIDEGRVEDDTAWEVVNDAEPNTDRERGEADDQVDETMETKRRI